MIEPNESRLGWLVSIAQGLAWLVTTCGAVVSALFIRETLLDILTWYATWRVRALSESGKVGQATELNFQMTAVDYFAIFILAGLTVCAVVFIEYYFRKGRPQGLLLKRVLKVAGIEVGIIVVTVLLRMLISI